MTRRTPHPPVPIITRLEAERARVEEWKAVADRFAAQTEQVLAAQARRSWWPWKRLG
jgi:hypothetical protein